LFFLVPAGPSRNFGFGVKDIEKVVIILTSFLKMYQDEENDPKIILTIHKMYAILRVLAPDQIPLFLSIFNIPEEKRTTQGIILEQPFNFLRRFIVKRYSTERLITNLPLVKKNVQELFDKDEGLANRLIVAFEL